jgi:hypothetical protein
VLHALHGMILMRGTGAQDDWRLERRAPGLPLSPVATLFKSPRRLEVESLFLRHQLNTAPAYLVCDNDGSHGQAFRRRVRAMGDP